MAEPSKIDLLMEAERRGILPPDKAELLAEARKRGLVGGDEPAADLTKTAVPAEPARGRSFGSYFSEEIGGGLEQAAQPFTDLSKDPNDRSLLGPANTPLGLMRAFPPQAAITATAHSLGDIAQRQTTPYLGHAAGSLVGAVVDVGTQFFAPGLMLSTLQKTGKFILPHLPGSQASRMEMAIENVTDDLASRVTKARGSYQVQQEAVSNLSEYDRIPVPGVMKTLDDIIAKAKTHTKAGEGSAASHARELRDRLNSLNGEPSLHWLDRELTTVGELTKSLASKGEAVDPQFARIFKSMATELEKTNPGRVYGLPMEASLSGPLIRAKDKSYRQMAGLEDVQEMFRNLVKTKRGMEGAIDVNANQVLDKLHKNQFVMDSLPKEDLKDIEVILGKVADLPMLPPGKGAMFGAGRAAGTTGIVGMAAKALGLDTGTAVVAGMGVAGLADLSRYLLPSRIGRKALRSVLESGPINQLQIDALMQIARGMSGFQTGILSGPQEIDDAVKKSLQSSTTSIDEKISAANDKSMIDKAMQTLSSVPEQKKNLLAPPQTIEQAIANAKTNYDALQNRVVEGVKTAGREAQNVTNIVDKWSRGEATPEERQQVVQNVIVQQGALIGGGTAFHGTPHEWAGAKPDLTKVGIGQGAQSYGYGLYFAENPAVAKQYVGEPMALMQKFWPGGKPSGKPAQVAEWLTTTSTRGKPDFNVLREKLQTIEPKASKQQIDKWITEGQDIYKQMQQPGSMYQVNIPDEHIAKMLDWDKPLSEQAPEIRKALNDIATELSDPKWFSPRWSRKAELLRDALQPMEGKSTTGQTIMGILGRDADVTDMLQRRGIPGIKYLDQGSRTAGQGTRNFVIFDPDIIKSVKKVQ